MRKRTEIDPVRAERVKEIIKDENLSNREFAKRLGMSPENLSRIVNKRHPLTEPTAVKILEQFPDYRKEWLLGYDDYKTVYPLADQIKDALAQGKEESEILDSALFGLAKLSGFTITPTETQPDRSVQSIVNAIKKGITFSRDGKSVSFSLAQLNEFENELCDYVEMRLKRMMK